MGFRRSPDRIAAARAWSRFVEHYAALLSAAGIPARITATITDWDEFLAHGYQPAHPGDFAVEQLNETQYSSLLEFASNYFAAGYEFFTPSALRAEHQAALRARFGPGA